MIPSDRNTIIKKSTLIFITSLPVIFFFWNIIVYSVNLPFRDDYTSVLLFINNWSDAKDFSSRLSLILEKHYGQIIVWNKMISLGIYSILGYIDFKVMTVIGNLGLLLIILPVYHFFLQKENKLLYFLPALFLFFQPMYSENIYQAMASVCNFYVISFGLLSLWMLSKSDDKNPLYFILAAIFGILSSLTQINGLIFLFLETAVLLFRKKWIKGIIWAAILILTILFYKFSAASGNIYSFNLNPGKIIDYLLYFFTFIGNNFGVNENSSIYTQGSGLLQILLKAVPIAAGVLISAYFIFLTVTAYYKKNLFLYAILVFLFISAAGAAVTRLDLGMITAVSSRYRILTILFLIVSYLSLIEIIPEKWKRSVFYSSLCAAVLFCAFSYTLKMKPIQNHREELVRNFKKWKETGTGLGPLAWPAEKGTAESILADSIKRNVYKVPEKLE